MPPVALTAAEILDLADAGRDGSAPLRGRLLLGAAIGEDDGDATGLDDVDAGTRDALVLELRAATLGRQVVGHLWCPACGTQLAVRLTAESLRREVPAAGTGPVVVEEDAWTVVARAPDGHALARAAASANVADGRLSLLADCVLSATCDGEAVDDVAALPDDVVAAVGAALLARDPALEVRISVTCALCAHPWSCCFDAPAFLWIELDALATRTLEEIHTLATAYGWDESTILALPSRRRHRYVERLAGV